MGKLARIDASPTRGMKDYLPAEVEMRAGMISVILDTYKRRGFKQIETPAVENLDRLLDSGGGDNEKLIFKILKRGAKFVDAFDDPDSLCDLGLRFDLTVPLARYYAQNFARLDPIFRSIQVGPVWRAERPQKGRLRQFMQCDIDIVGEASVLAELELISTSLDAVAKLGVDHLTLRYNDRRFLDALLNWSNIPHESWKSVLVVMDKLDKIGREGVISEIVNLNFEPKAQAKITSYLEFAEPLSKLPLGFFSEIGLSDGVISDLEAIAGLANSKSLNGVKFVFDPTVIRGMGYYTGPIFELGVDDMAVSVGGGGRYDSMMGRFGRPAPACGFSLGFERLAIYLETVTAESASGPAQLYIRCDVPSDYPRALEIARTFSGQNVTVAIGGSSRKLDAVLRSLRIQYGSQTSMTLPWVALLEVSALSVKLHRIVGDAPEIS